MLQRKKVTFSVILLFILFMVWFLIYETSSFIKVRPSTNVTDISELILSKLNDIEKTMKEQQSYIEYKKYRDEMKLALPKIIDNENQKINPHVLVDTVEKNHAKRYKMLVLISSNTPHEDRRNLIRKNWGNESMWATKGIFKVIFVIGGSSDRGAMNKLYIEVQKQHDIIIEDVEESFYSLSKKVMIGLQWAHSNFNYDFILKADDDVFVQMDRLMHLINTNDKEGYFGQVMVKQPVMRNGRYGLTKEEHSNDYFDPYCSGGSFIISFDTVNKIIPLFNWENPLKIDDAYFGHLVYKAGVKVKHENGFHFWNRWCEYTDILVVSHPVRQEECMNFLQAKSLIENGKLDNNTLKNEKYAFDEETRKKL